MRLSQSALVSSDCLHYRRTCFPSLWFLFVAEIQKWLPPSPEESQMSDLSIVQRVALSVFEVHKVFSSSPPNPDEDFKWISSMHWEQATSELGSQLTSILGGDPACEINKLIYNNEFMSKLDTFQGSFSFITQERIEHLRAGKKRLLYQLFSSTKMPN